MRAARICVAAMVVAGIWLAACSLTNTDGLTGGLDDSGVSPFVPDATVMDAMTDDSSMPVTTRDAGDASDGETEATDSGTDADADDADASADAAQDAADAADAAPPPPFCTSPGTHTLCSDFDEGSLAYDQSSGTAQWFVIGSPSLDRDASLSPPGSLDGYLNQTSPGSTTDNALAYGVGLSAHAIAVSFDLRPNFTPPFSTRFWVTKVSQVVNPNYYGLTFGFDATGAFVEVTTKAADGGVGDVVRYLPSIVGHTWTRVALYETFSTTAGQVTASLNGTQVLNETLPTSTVGNTSTTLEVGIEGNGSIPNVSVNIDNVVVDVTP